MTGPERPLALLGREQPMRSFDPPRSGGVDRRPADRPRHSAIGARPASAEPRPPAAARAPGGLPERLRTVMEAMSGFSLADVVVHRNSAEPARLGAAAFTQGNRIHLAPGEERHLAHEAWHVVQQAQGRVKPTLQMKGGVPVNDEVSLEREADAMGAAALLRAGSRPAAAAAGEPRRTSGAAGTQVVQRLAYDILSTGKYYKVAGHDRVLYLWVKRREGVNAFTPHARLKHPTIEVTSLDDIERIATPEEIATANVDVELLAHRDELAQFERLSRQIDMYDKILRDESRNLDPRTRSQLRNRNIALVEESQRIVTPVIVALFGTAASYDDLRTVMRNFLSGKLPGTPWFTGRLTPESNAIVERLKTITDLGMITYESQPSGHPDPSGPPGVAIHQAAFLELSGPPDLMDQLDRAISRANRTAAHKISVLRPGEKDLMPLRVAVAAREESLTGLGVEPDQIERGRGHVFARLGNPVHNNSRYFDKLAKVPGLARILKDHVTLLLVSDTYEDRHETLLFDQVIDLVHEARTALIVKALAEEPVMEESEQLTSEETGTGHLDDLI